MFLVARTSSDPAGSTRAIMDQIHAIDPSAAVYEIRSMQDRLYDSLARQRFSTTMLSVFAGLALVLAAIGIYGVMAYLVNQGAREMGIRIALGATPRNILLLVVKSGMTLALCGVASGLAGALLLTKAMGSLLYGIDATDPFTYISISGMLMAIALVACYFPARRAARVDPMISLRCE